MTAISMKLRELLKNLKSDAVPKPPREDTDNDSKLPQEENIQEERNGNPEKKTKPKKAFFKGNKKQDDFEGFKHKKDDKRSSCSSTVNTQATGNVINIVNAEGLHFGNEYVYYLGQNNGQKQAKTDDGETIEKDNLIQLVMEAETKPEHIHIDYISKNLGKNWHSIFRALGYTKGRIETVEIDEARNGVSEARYKLLLDWVRNDEVGTLGSLATTLWQEGERQVVKELSILHKKHKY